MRNKVTFTGKLATWSLVCLCSLTAFAMEIKSPTPGRVIENQAQVFYTVPGDDFSVVIGLSNISTAVVGADYGLELTSDRTQTVVQSQLVQFAHTLVNRGNTPDSFDVSALNLGGDTTDLGNLVVYLDSNGNGIPDSGDSIISRTPSLPPGELVSLVVVGEVPATVTNGDEIHISLTATSVGNPAESRVNLDRALVVDGALIRISMTSSVACNVPVLGGSELTYNISFNNSGDQDPLARQHMVAGVSRTGVMLESRLPSDVNLISGQTLQFVPFQAEAVLLLAKDLVSESWTSYASWNGTDKVVRVGLLTPSNQLRPNQSGSLSFRVQVSPNVTLNSVLINRVVIDEDGNGLPDFASADVCNTTRGPEADIRFMSPSFDNIRHQVAPSFDADEDFSATLRYRFENSAGSYNATFDGVYVDLRSTSIPDSNLQFLADGRRQVIVNVTSAISGQTVPLVVRETEVGSGHYRSLLPIVLSTATSATGQLCGDPFGEPDYESVPPSSCTLLSGQNDQLLASFFDRGLGEIIDDASIVDPLGFVFNSLTLAPVPGAEVRIFNAVDNGPGGLQDQLANDPFAAPGTPLAIEVTDAIGFYQYPFMFPGSYYMTVTLPANAGYLWPSRRSPLIFSGMDVSDFSYGRDGFGGLVANSGVFHLDEENPIVAVDFPVDPVELDLSISGQVSCDADLTDGDPILYSTAFSNSGNLTPPERDIFVDGLLDSGVVVQSSIPLDTVLNPAVIPLFSPLSARLILKLYDGSAEDRWVSYEAWIALAEADRLPVRAVGLLVPASDMEPSVIVGQPGEGGDLSFGVLVVGNITAGTQIVNRLTVDLDGDGASDITSPEDFQNACESLTGPPPSIRFLAPTNNSAPQFDNDSSFADAAVYSLRGNGNPYDVSVDGIYLELTSTSVRSSDFELLEDGRRRVLVTVSSDLTGDSLQVVLEEIAFAEGRYRSIRPIILDASQTSTGATCPAAGEGANYLADPGPACVLQGAANDLLTLAFLNRFEPVTGLADLELTDLARVNPEAFVFSSQFPFDGVPGLMVRFYPLSEPPGSPRGEPVAGPYVTADNGAFAFPELPVGEYYLEVESTDIFAFPSVVDRDYLHANSGYRIVDSSFGFGDGQVAPRDGGVTQSKPFEILPGAVISPFDIPVDPLSGNAALVVQKLASKDRVDIGGLIEYSLRITNVGDGLASDIELFDRLPFGFKYIEGTLRQNDLAIADPVGAPGPLLTFDGGNLSANEFVTFSYVLQATSGARDSDGINRAQAIGTSGGGAVVSNEASVQVRVEMTGVLSDRGIIFGKIFVDQDCNNLQSQGEWPIGGVALYMEDGTYAITDENGQYSLYGIRPGNHSLKIDPLTMPQGLRLKPIDNRQLAAPGSRLVDLRDGEFHRADFAVACPDAEDVEFVYAQVAARNESIKGDWLTQNSASFDAFARASARAGISDDDLSSGTLLAAGEFGSANAAMSPVTPLFRDLRAEEMATTEEEVQQAVVVEEAIHRITTEQAYEGLWLWPLDDISLYGRFVVAVRDRIEADLYVNGELVPRAQIGEQAHNAVTDVQVLAWYGVQLRDGKNLVEVKTRDAFGNDRVLLSREFVSPGNAVRMEVIPERTLLAADGGRSVLPIEVTVLDADGYPARGLHFITVETTGGQLIGEDLQPATPGFQARLDRGSKTLQLQSSNQTGPVTLRVTSDDYDQSVQIDFVAAQRSLLVSGIAESQIGTCDLDSGAYAPTALDCENGLQGERVAMFMKGSIKGGMFLTLSYDSDKVADGELLRDLNPEEYYPIFGDSSVRGFEAQSRSKLYAKLEMDRSFLQWGDFVTDRDTGAQDLGRVQRTLTGVNTAFEQGPLRLAAFAAEVDDQRQSLEFPGNGTAMLYRINAAPIVPNSELVEWVVRDRDNAGLVLSARALTRFVDYTLDAVSGNLRFTRVVPTLDQDLNPVSIRISFDVEGTAGTDLVAGVRAALHLDENIVVGGSFTHDDNATTGFQITSAFFEAQPIEGAKVIISSARMQHQDAALQSGNALYAEVQMNWDGGSQSSLRWGRADAGFTNSGSGVSADREEARASHQQQITKSLTLAADYVASNQISSADNRDSLEVSANYTIGDWSLRLGGRRIEQVVGGTADDANTIIAGAGRAFTLFDRRGNIKAEFERELGQQNRERWLLGATWQAHEKLAMYGNFEQINSLSGPSSLVSGQQTISASFGLESELLPSTRVFNEYRVQSVIDGRDLEAAVGIRGDYQIREGLTISPSFERIETLQGAQGREATAMSLSIEDQRRTNARNLIRIESRFDEDRDYYGLDWSYVARVNLDWSSFVREQVSYRVIDGSENELAQSLTIGMALRPRETNQYHALYMYQWKEERGGGTLGDRTVHLVSTHQNYQLNDDWIVSGRAGFKYERQPLLNSDFSSLVGVIDARLIWDITRRLDFDLHGGVLGTNSFAESRYAFGLGFSYMVMQGLRVGVGYNLLGFNEGDLDGEGYNRRGIYIHAQYKFDESQFRWLGSDAFSSE